MAETLTWIDPDGTSHTMADAAVTTSAVLQGVEGMFSPPFDLIADEVPLEDGERVGEVRAERRTVLMPFRVYAASETELRTSVRAWATRLNPHRGEGTLRWTGPDGASRDLACRCVDFGRGGVMDGHDHGRIDWFQTVVLTMRASDPWWYDSSPTTVSFTGASQATFFPFFPLSLSSSEVFDEAAVSNGGDIHAWPTITIMGPATDPVIRNVTTGRLLDFTGVTLSAGESIEVDTSPGVKTVLKSDGSNLFSSLSSSSSLWRLQRGANTVRAEMSGTDADSQVDLVYRRRWLSA